MGSSDFLSTDCELSFLYNELVLTIKPMFNYRNYFSPTHLCIVRITQAGLRYVASETQCNCSPFEPGSP